MSGIADTGRESSRASALVKLGVGVVAIAMDVAIFLERLSSELPLHIYSRLIVTQYDLDQSIWLNNCEYKPIRRYVMYASSVAAMFNAAMVLRKAYGPRNFEQKEDGQFQIRP